MTRHKYIIALGMLGAILCSCTKQHGQQQTDGLIRMMISTKAGDETPEGKILASRLLICTEDRIGSMGQEGFEPYHDLLIDNIYQWNDKVFNTYVKYPQDNRTVYLNAVAPASADNSKPDTGKLYASDNWASFRMNYPTDDSGNPAYDNSLWGNVVVSNTLHGTLDNQVSGHMQYHYPSAKFTFSAYKEEKMKNYNVRNVVVSSGAAILPYSLAWNAGNKEYCAFGGASQGISFLFANNDGVDIMGLGEEKAIQMPPFYFLPQENNSIGPFDIEASYYVDGDSASTKVHRKSNVWFDIVSDRNGNPVSEIKAGEAYRVIIRFNQDSFDIIGVKCDDWQDGGNVVIPVINETNDM